MHALVETAPRTRAKRPGLPLRPREALPVLLPALLAAGLCLYGITDRSLGFDESATFAIVSQHGAALRSAIAHDGGNMSGYYVLMHALVSLFGSSLLVLRLPSALAIAAAVAITGVLGRRLFERRVGLAGGVLTAVSLPLVFWGQSARSYALLVAFVAASFLAFVELVVEDRSRRARTIVWAAYILASALALYMSLMALLAVLAQVLLFPWWRGRARAVGSALVAIAALAVPLALLVAGRGSSQVAWVSAPTLTDLDQVFEALTGAGLQPTMHATATTPALLALTGAVLVACAVAIALGLWRRPGRQRLFGPALLLSWLVVPVLVTYVESLVAQPLFLPRNLLYCAPAVALVLAWGLTRPRVPVVVAVAAVAAFVALRALQVAPSYGVSPEDWRGATTYVLRHTSAGDCLAFYPSDGRMAFQYYLTHPSGPPGLRAPRPVLPRAPWSRLRPYVEDYAVPPANVVAQFPAVCTRLWFIFTHPGRRHGSTAARADYRRYLQLRAVLEREYPRHTERRYGYASAVHVELLSG